MSIAWTSCLPSLVNGERYVKNQTIETNVNLWHSCRCIANILSDQDSMVWCRQGRLEFLHRMTNVRNISHPVRVEHLPNSRETWDRGPTQPVRLSGFRDIVQSSFVPSALMSSRSLRSANDSDLSSSPADRFPVIHGCPALQAHYCDL